MTEKGDAELSAIKSLIEALEPLDVDARQRVVAYVFQRLNLPLSVRTRSTMEDASSQVTQSQYPDREFQQIVDIRSIKETKNPSSANEMAALVAYYLIELAPLVERKQSVDTTDLTKYFKQAGFPLPSAIKNTLSNAARSGYFEVSGNGKYKLTPVGYNLVVHGLPKKQQGK